MSTAKKKLTTCQPKTAVAYARYSSASQRDVSIEQQLKDIRAYAEREGYTIIHEYADHAKSGFKNSERREEFRTMLKEASYGMFDTVIAWKVDRFGRDRRESATFKGQLADQGVSVVYAMEPIPDGAAGCLTEGMLEAIAEWYSRNLSENVKRGMSDNARKGLYNGVSLYGYRKGPNGTYVIDEAEAAIIHKIFTLYSENYSFESINRALAADGFKFRNGKPFLTPTISYILKNETYNGVYHFGSSRIPDGVPKIIDDDLWMICQELRKKTASKHTRVFDYALSGKCTCGLCGSTVVGNFCGIRKTREKYVYYSCRAHRSNRNLCSLKSRRKYDVEDKVFSFLYNEVMSGNLLNKFMNDIDDILANQQEASPIVHLKRELADVNKKINNITQAISEGIWTKQTASMLENLNNRAEELQREITYRASTEKASLSKDRVRFLYEKMARGDITDSNFRRTMVNALINSIVFYNDYIQIAVNVSEYTGTVPPDEFPPIEETPEYNFDSRINWAARLFIVKNHPVVVFKIAA